MQRTNLARRNHYVRQWYQRRFLAENETHFYYLDLEPGNVVLPGKRKYQRRAIMRWGPKRCFYHDDLYTLKLGQWVTDEIERTFFGPIDYNGKTAVEFFSDYSLRDGARDAFHSIMKYMSAQRFRTPRGLDHLGTIIDIRDQNLALIMMRSVFQVYATMWSEGVWEIVSAARSSTKFLLTDNPVTFYNTKAFPKSIDCLCPNDVDLDCAGTRTIFPLSREACLIISHVQLVRNPWVNPRKDRVNSRAYGTTLVNLADIQTGRELEEDEVRRINFILRQRAMRYIAASQQDWLYPEDVVSTSHWSKLDDDWFLFPNLYKVPFSGGVVVGYKNGSSWAIDEHGRTPRHPKYQDKELHDQEWRQHLKAQKVWAIKREGRSIAKVHGYRPNSAYDAILVEELKNHHAVQEQQKSERLERRRRH